MAGTDVKFGGRGGALDGSKGENSVTGKRPNGIASEKGNESIASERSATAF
jgi:hypothetical protein